MAGSGSVHRRKDLMWSGPSEKKSDVEQNGDVLQSGGLLLRLPPLPEPDYASLRPQVAVGCATVLGTCLAFVTLTLTASVVFHELPRAARRAFPPMICMEASVAIICLLGLVFGDPGVIPRCPEFSLPLPREIEELVHEGHALEHLEALKNLSGDDGWSYCVRCFVWRPPRSHHCRMCGRCVRDFDHHCGVFGRCIAGKRLHGNMKYFVLVIAMGWGGGLTCAACVVWSASLRWGLWALPYLFLAYLGFACISMLMSGLYLLVRKITETCYAYEKVAVEDFVESVKYGAEAPANAASEVA